MADPRVQERLRLMRIFTLAMIGGVLAFAVVVVVLIDGGSFETGALPGGSTLLAAAAVAGALLLGAAPALKRRMAGSGPEATSEEVLQRAVSAHLVATAIREGVGLYGLVLGLMAGSVAWSLGFAAASVGAMAMDWPGEEELAARLRRMETPDA